MRRRLLAASLTVAMVAVVLLGLPLAWVGDRLLIDEAQRTTGEVASRIARTVDEQLETDQSLSVETLSLQVGPQRHVIVLLPDGSRLAAGVEGATTARSRVTTTQGASVSVAESAEVLRDRRGTLFLLVAVASGVALVAAAAVGTVAARRLGAPLVDLARAAERFGEGQANVPPVRSGVPEVDTVGRVLQASGQRVADTLAAESRFASEVSHQLRTPLTALSLRLEEVVATDSLHVAHDEAQAALVQVARLAEVVSTLRSRSRTARTGLTTEVDVGVLVAQQVDEWRPAFLAAGRDVRLDSPQPLTAIASPGGLTQVVATLLENSLVHGAGRTTVRTLSRGHSVVVDVSDEGPGIPVELGSRVFERSVSGGRGSGLGLALARDLAEADGGRLALLAYQPVVFALFLPVPPPVPSSGDRLSDDGATREKGQPASTGSAASSSVAATTSGKTKRR